MNEKINNFKHVTVRLEDAVDCLNVKENNIYVDCTFGRGGHSLEILKRLNNTGKLFVFDTDSEAEEFFNKNFKNYKNIYFIKSNFRNIKDRLNSFGVSKVDGILYDFGVSSPMFDNPERGFTYRKDGLLDMRMNQEQELTAFNVINFYSKEKLLKLFKEYGDIKFPNLVVDEIIKQRTIKPIKTTLQLVDIIKSKTPVKLQYAKKHFARTYFQAIRIEVNDELNAIKESLVDALEILNQEGRIVTISFHSLEERIVKNIYRNVLENKIPKEIPINNFSNFKIIKLKSKKASLEELEQNSRTRSSILKVIEKVS